MKKNSICYLLLLMMAVFTMASCSEDSGEVEEFADWQHKNETYFAQLHAATQERIAKGDQNWKIIRNWSLPADGQNFHADLNNYIIVHVLERGNSTSGSPLYTDSVMVSYRGRLIPSATYTAGYLFDRSYSGTYNPQTMNPAKFAVSGLVDGFTTALLHMSVGDRWEVYIPYKLGYGTEKAPKSEIPGYSTLIFDIGLAGYYRPKAPTRAGMVSGSWVKK